MVNVLIERTMLQTIFEDPYRIKCSLYSYFIDLLKNVHTEYLFFDVNGCYQPVTDENYDEHTSKLSKVYEVKNITEGCAFINHNIIPGAKYIFAWIGDDKFAEEVIERIRTNYPNAKCPSTFDFRIKPYALFSDYNFTQLQSMKIVRHHRIRSPLSSSEIQQRKFPKLSI